jgi:hypothetical protein
VQVSGIKKCNQKLAQQAQKILRQYFRFNSFDETWQEECQEDGGKRWTKTDGGFEKLSFIRPLIRCNEDAASSPAASLSIVCQAAASPAVPSAFACGDDSVLPRTPLLPQSDDPSTALTHDSLPLSTGGGPAFFQSPAARGRLED